MVSMLSEDLRRISNRTRFILEVVKGDLIVSNRKRADLLADLERRGYAVMRKKTRKPRARAAIEEEDEDEQDNASYDYLLSMPIWSLTLEKVRLRKLCHEATHR
jgi:DNA topoisomerase-2